MADIWKTAEWVDILDWMAKAGLESWLEMMNDEYPSKEEFLKALVSDRNILVKEFDNIADNQTDIMNEHLRIKLKERRDYYFKWVIEDYFEEQLANGDPAAIAAIL